MTEQGLLHLYIGDGKGKTTAAVGLAARMAGVGGKVLFLQFLKGSATGELDSLARLGIPVLRTGEKGEFLHQMNDGEREACRQRCAACFEEARGALAGGEYRLVVLDEVLDAANTGMVSIDALLNALDGRAPWVEVVLTGRNPDPRLVERADYVSDICCRKHPCQRGIAARRGVEY